MIKFRCSHCQQKLGVPDDYAGRRIRCSKCNQPNIVPAPAAVSPVPAGVPDPPGKRGQVQPALRQSVPVPVFPQPQPEAVENLENLDILPDVPQETEEDSRQAAIRQAAQERLKHTGRTERQTKNNRSGSEGTQKDDSGGLPLLDKIPDLLRLPLGLVFSFIGVGMTILIWMMCSRAAESALCFAALFVPLAAGLVLRLFVAERTLLLGLAAVAIGGLGIAAGKVAIARYVVIPFYHKTAEEVVLADLKTVLADPKAQLPESQSAKFIVKDGDFMTCVAMVSLVEDGLADPAEAGARAVKILRESKKLNVLEFFDAVTSGGSQSVAMPELGEEEEPVMGLAYDRMAQWADQEQEFQMARKYYPAFFHLARQADMQRVLEDPKLTYHAALLNTLGLLDLVWIMLGLGLGYILAVYD